MAKRRGSSAPPKRSGPKAAPAEKPIINRDNHPHLYLGVLEKGWGLSDLTPEQALSFVTTWEKRSSFTWTDLSSHHRHGLGSEFLPVKVFKPAVPRWLDGIEKLRVFRYHGNLPLVGHKINDVFYPVWIEREFNTLYDHG